MMCRTWGRIAAAVMVVAAVVSATALAQTPSPAADPPITEDLLPGRPDADPDAPRLAGPFSSLAAGIRFQPPAGGISQRRGSDEIVRYTGPDASWSFFVQRHSLQNPLVLSQESPDKPRGMLEIALDQLRQANPALTVLRSDVTNLGQQNTGILVTRYTLGTQTYLNQQAIVQADSRLYYFLTYLSAGDREPDPDRPSEAETRAVATFQAVLDTVDVLDRTEVKQDQDDRLFRTRAMFESWTPQNILAAVVPHQWFRVLRNGKDVGYIYMIQEPQDQGERAGIKVGIRARQIDPQGRQTDSESWMYSTLPLGNRFPRNETFSHVTLVPGEKGKEFATEIGSSDRIEKAVAVGGRLGQPTGAALTFEYKLVSQTITHKGDRPSIQRELPPFYLPQAVGQLLPRLLPVDEPKGFLFAAWVGDAREVMLRYVDVKKERRVTLDGQSMIAVPIEDKLGLEGAVTTHYVADGTFVGSQTQIEVDGQPAVISVLPADEPTLLGIWKDADLSRPSEPAVAPAGAAPTGAAPATATPAPAR